jgi:recombination protein RecT
MANNALEVIRGDVYSVADQFESIKVDRNINFEAEAGFAMQTLMANDYALGVAMKNRQSVINAVTNIAAIGISLNPAKKQAYLVPRDGRICLDISYMGLMDLAMQSGSIRWAQCALVHEADTFELAGLDKQPVHRFNPFAKDRGPIVGVYAVVKTCDGDYLTHTMPIADVHAIRDKSSAWIAFIGKKTRSCIWLDHEGEMVKKTCIKQAYKYWPKGEQSGRLEGAIHYMNEQAGEGIQKESHAPNLRITATDGAMESMPLEIQNILRELAGEAIDAFRDDSASKAMDVINAAALDNEQAVALWTLLPSDMRAALKVEKKARQEAAQVLAA